MNIFLLGMVLLSFPVFEWGYHLGRGKYGDIFALCLLWGVFFLLAGLSIMIIG